MTAVCQVALRVGDAAGFCTELRFHVVELTCRINYSLLITIILLILLKNFYKSSLAPLSLSISNVCPSILLSIHHPSACLNIIYLSIFLFIYLHIYIYNYLFLYLSIYLSFYGTSIYRSSIYYPSLYSSFTLFLHTWLSVYLSVCMDVILSLCRAVCVYISIYTRTSMQNNASIFLFFLYKIRCTRRARSKGTLLKLRKAMHVQTAIRGWLNFDLK